MFKTLKQFFDFCNKEDRSKLYLAIALGVVNAIFAALRMPAIAVVVQGLIDGQMTMKHLWLSLGIMIVSVLSQFLINLKTTMLQCEAGYLPAPISASRSQSISGIFRWAFSIRTPWVLSRM